MGPAFLMEKTIEQIKEEHNLLLQYIGKIDELCEIANLRCEYLAGIRATRALCKEALNRIKDENTKS
jgi:hypothetical protein